MFEVHIYISINSNSPRVSEKQYGYVLETQVLGNPRTCEGFGTLTSTYHKAVLTALVEAMKRLNQSCEVHIHTEDRFVLSMLKNNAPQWAENDFKNNKGSSIANREEWEELLNLVSRHIVIPVHGTHAYDNWIKEVLKNPEVLGNPK